MAEMVYLQLAESVLAEKRKVLIRDVSKVVSDNPDQNLLQHYILCLKKLFRKFYQQDTYQLDQNSNPCLDKE